MAEKSRISLKNLDKFGAEWDYVRSALLTILKMESHKLVRDVLKNIALHESLVHVSEQTSDYFAWRAAETELLRSGQERLLSVLKACDSEAKHET